jgi:hypothetical protein
MGHVINYAYKLYDDEDWVKLFGSMNQPYLEDYRPSPFSRRFVRHLPGWYAQKHPDEDWSETFAVWMTPGRNWRQEYAEQPTVLTKLEYCDRTMDRVRQRAPLVTATDLDEDVGDLGYSLKDFYQRNQLQSGADAGLEGDLRSLFDDFVPSSDSHDDVLAAGSLIRRMERRLMDDVFRWTGHFPERTRVLVRHLANRADALHQVYPRDSELAVMSGVAVLVTSLAMNHVHRGAYFPESRSSDNLVNTALAAATRADRPV